MAIISSIGFLIIGMDEKNLPPYSIGYINIPILLCINLPSLVSVPIGIKLSTQLPTKILKRIFTFLICILAIKMMSEIFITL
jgi:uncharacterized membrane protein YfcA